MKLLGALAFSIHCPRFSYMQQILGRTFTDIDFASYGRETGKISKLFDELGYQEDLRVTTLFGGQRLVFRGRGETKRNCDVFPDKLEFCHSIPFGGRLEEDGPTVPLAELLLEKMQIVKLNEKDVIDTVMLLREHYVGDSDKETVNSTRVARLCGSDWGLWKTVTTNLRRMTGITRDMAKLSEEDQSDVTGKIETLLKQIEAEPKTMAWKMRAVWAKKESGTGT